LIIDAMGLGKLSVGPPYFNTVFVPLMMPLLFLMAIGPLANWKRADAGVIASRLKVVAVVALAAGAGLPWLIGKWTPLVASGLLLAVWISGSVVLQVQSRLRSGKPPLSYWGMQCAHLGIAIFVIGVTLVKGYEVEKDVRMQVGDTVSVGGYDLKLTGLDTVQGPNYEALRAQLSLSRQGKALRVLQPEKRHYNSSQMPMTETAIDTGLLRDVYVSLGEQLEGGQAWAVRVYYKPFVDWIWVGCVFMALGGALAAADKRYRIKVRRQPDQAAAAQGATA
jgi:cytochrome c-type biogenesis protein CcmF